jgi:outer membrane immunogenic protein
MRSICRQDVACSEASKVATMKKLVPASLSVLFAASSALPALAADLPSRKAAPVYAAPAATWTGFYAGLNAGGAWSNNESVGVSTWSLNNRTRLTALLYNQPLQTAGNVGFIGGGQIGYNWQLSGIFNRNLVSGIEADIAGIAVSSGSADTNSAGVVRPFFSNWTVWNSTKARASLGYIGTVRGRLGYLLTPVFLVYGTGGLVYGGANLNVDRGVFVSNSFGPLAYGFASSNYAATQVGWTAGGGLEWMFSQNWSAKAEYLYYDMGQANANMTTTAAVNNEEPFVASTSNLTHRFNGNIVRAGANYHFSWGTAPVVASY